MRVEVVGTSPDVRASVGYLRVQRDEPTRAVRIHFAGGQRVESDGITLEIEMTSVSADTGLWRHAVEVCNVTPFDGDDLDAVMDVSPTSLLVVLYGSFVSSIAPPAHAAAAVAACRCTGLHPVLVGDGAMLGSPIVLPDHPMVDEIFE
ncbi:MAG TPA: hypothetical protein VL326_05090 [Kofleriaceae bacterium]|nr:hypothetical protein [Kofleriaceae bacterium]